MVDHTCSSPRDRAARTGAADHRLARAVHPVVLAVLACSAGCAGVPSKSPPPLAAPAAVAGSTLDLGATRRCVDNLLQDSGVRDIVLTVDEVADATRPRDTVARDALAAAISGMAQRSRAIRVVAAAGDGAAQATLPRYTLRGSIHAEPGNASALGLDLTLYTTSDMSVVPGAASRRVVVVAAPTAGREERVEFREFGLPFSVPTGTEAGAARGTRALIELGAIQLVGRLAKVPYWTCFGAGANQAGVAAEIQDWYDTMAARPAEIIGFFQQQLRQRGLYDGPVDGAVNPPFKQAVAQNREALGLSREAKLSLDFFRAWLAADHRALAERFAKAPAPASIAAPPALPGPAPSVAASPAVTSPVSPTPSATLALRVATPQAGARFERGEVVRLDVVPSRDAHVYCFHQDESRRIVRFFPNRFQSDSRVPASGVTLPGDMRFEIAMNKRGVAETIACFATDSDVLAKLPAGLHGRDFDALPVASLDQVRAAFLKAAHGSLAQDSLRLLPR